MISRLELIMGALYNIALKNEKQDFDTKQEQGSS
jgi:hypothetical protein